MSKGAEVSFALGGNQITGRNLDVAALAVQASIGQQQQQQQPARDDERMRQVGAQQNQL